MDIPFTSSGAMSRSHYSLVRKVEDAVSPSIVDQLLQSEVDSIRLRLARPGLPQCKECLVILLYCSMSSSSGISADGTLYFALPHAVNLAEAGITLHHKRIGYLFCTEVMPPSHELQLMLINTIRKDLENNEVSRICLALDALIKSTTADVIPAVQMRLHDLLSHNSNHVRRRALLAFRALSIHEPELLIRISNKIFKRMNDPFKSVVCTAVLVSTRLARVHDSSRVRVGSALSELLKSTWSEKSSERLLVVIFDAIREVGTLQDNIALVLKVIHSASGSRSHVLLRSAFNLLQGQDAQISALSKLTARSSPVQDIRKFLTSRDPNHLFLFLSCLECVHPGLWAGTQADRPAILEGWEVERIMQLLDSPDQMIRRKTLRILSNVDVQLIASYYTQTLQRIPQDLNITAKNEYATKLLDVLETQFNADGEAFAAQLRQLLTVLEGSDATGPQPVLEGVMQTILTLVQSAPPNFALSFVTVLITGALESDSPLGPTLLLIVSALASEYSGKLSVPPTEIMRGIACRINACRAAVQDACLLAMLRISADCNDIPTDVVATVKGIMQSAHRHIRRRCNQFLELSSQRTILTAVVKSARSSSLPDFLDALQKHESTPAQTIISSNSSQTSRSSAFPISGDSTSHKLRYAAYEPPVPAPRLRRRASSSQRSVTSSVPDETRSNSELSRVGLIGSMAMTATAGELALAGGTDELEMMARVSEPDKLPTNKSSIEDLSSRIDLIAFDSPFISDRPNSVEPRTEGNGEVNLESMWNTLGDSSGVRGWCDASTEGIVRRLQQTFDGYRLHVIPADFPPFEGDLKVSISIQEDNTLHAALRLKEGEEESCLWRLRCADAGLRTRVKQLLTDES